MIPALAPHLKALEHLCRQYRVRRLELFGVAARVVARKPLSGMV